MSSQPQVVQQQVPMSKLLEEIGRLTVQLRISEENGAQLTRNSEALAKRLQETLADNAELKTQLGLEQDALKSATRNIEVLSRQISALQTD